MTSNDHHYYAVILAGGRGERFWPLSTVNRPKQLLSLVGEKAMIAQAVDRLVGLVPPERILVITNRDLVEATRKACPDIPEANIVGEPVGRDTAPAVALAAALVKARDSAGVFAILTADHVIGNLDVFRSTLRDSMELASRDDVLITIGIKPTEPATGYGYIHLGASCSAGKRGTQYNQVRQFVEKPDLNTAREYVESGDYAWNSGMFIWSARALEQALLNHCPAIGRAVEILAAGARENQFEDVLEKTFAGLEKISIDYAVMEKADNIIAAEGTFAWDDVGSWSALENYFPKDEAGNVQVGACVSLDATGNIVFSRERLTALLGVQDLIIVQSENATLICPRSRDQDIKQLVAKLRASGAHNEVL